ncbi:hypothetical protein Aperf_G00000091325 [Anoplocephala perfoliata]
MAICSLRPRYYVGTQAHFKNAFFDAFFHVGAPCVLELEACISTQLGGPRIFLYPRNNRDHHVNISFDLLNVGYSISLLLIITSGILLALKLDNDLRLPCVIVASPLMSALTVFMSLCFSVRPHFQWRRCFQLLYRRIIKMCHPLQEYGNISYKLSSLHQSSSYDLPGRDGNQPSPPSGSDPQMITTSPPQPPPPPFMQPTPLVRVEIPKSSPKSAVLNADSLERQFLPHFLIPCRRKSKKRVLGTAGRVGGEGPGGDSDCSDTAISTRLDAPD